MDNTEKTVFIYGLIDPRTEELRYVGVTTNPHRREKEHRNDKRGRNKRTNWLKSLKCAGLSPKMIVIEEVPVSKRNEREIFWIAHYRGISSCLVNMTDGGDGLPEQSQKAKERLREMFSGVKNPNYGKRGELSPRWGKACDPEVRKKISEAQMGERNHRWGKKNSEDHRRKIGEGNKGKVFTTERKSKISAALTGKHLSEETKKKLSEINTGGVKSEEVRAKQSQSLKGKPKSPEHIEAVRRALEPYWEKKREARRIKEESALMDGVVVLTEKENA